MEHSATADEMVEQREENVSQLVSVQQSALEKINNTQKLILQTVQQFVAKLTEVETKVDAVYSGICGKQAKSNEQLVGGIVGTTQSPPSLPTVKLSLSQTETESTVQHTVDTPYALSKDDSSDSFNLSVAELEVLERSVVRNTNDVSLKNNNTALALSSHTAGLNQSSMKPFTSTVSSSGRKRAQLSCATTSSHTLSKSSASTCTSTQQVNVVVHDDGKGKIQTIVPGGLIVSWESCLAGFHIDRNKYLEQMTQCTIDVVGVALSVDQLRGTGVEPSQNFYEVFSLLMTHIVTEEIGVVYSSCQVFLSGFFNNVDDDRNFMQYLEELPEPVYTAAKFCSDVMFSHEMSDENRLSVLRAAVADVQLFVTCYTDYEPVDG